MTGLREVTTWYLQMGDESELKPARPPAKQHDIARVVQPSAAFARYLYTAVGGDWHWTDRLVWSKARWDDYLARAEVQLYALSVDGAAAGYAELEAAANGDVQLVYFGVIPEVVGQGFGGWLLTRAVQAAWQTPGARRTWVHTCTLDAPSALSNYQKRGFGLYRTETRMDVVAKPPGPWPGWDGSGSTPSSP